MNDDQQTSLPDGMLEDLCDQMETLFNESDLDPDDDSNDDSDKHNDGASMLEQMM
ncbi:MAG: hypothetical protein ACI8RD_003111 [Bacillariaceae sp.]|jgi:hypothetical protein